MKRTLIRFAVWLSIAYILAYFTVYGQEIFTWKFFRMAVTVTAFSVLIFNPDKIAKWLNPKKEESGSQTNS